MEGAPLFVENGPERKTDRIESGKSKSEKAETVGLFAVEHADHISSNKNIETLNRPELLNLSEKIIVDGSSLRQIYESKLVAERGLRRLVAEHLRGGDLRKALRQEIVEREIDFERDPSLRDLSLATPKDNSTAVLNRMLDKASAALGGKEEEIAFFKARADYEAKQGDYQQKQSRLISLGLILTIAILLLLIIILLFMKG